MTNSIIKKQKNQWLGLAWIALPMVFIIFFCAYPSVMAVTRSLTNWSPSTNEFVWFDNFINLFKSDIFWKACYNMVILVFVSMLVGNIATFTLAEMLFNFKLKRVNKFFKYLFLLPSLVPGMVTLLLWRTVILSGDAGGVFNNIIGLFGYEPNAWYFDEKLSKFSIIMTNFPWVGGIGFLIYLAGLLAIPESCIEASKIDGITFIKRLFYIDIPLSVSQFKYFFIIGLVGGVQAFDMQLIVTDGGPNFSTTVPGFMIYQNTYGYNKYGEASAIGVLLFSITLSATLISNKITNKLKDSV